MTIPKFSFEQIDDAYDNLDPIVAEALLRVDIDSIVPDIGTRHRLHLDEIDTLRDLVTYQTIGLLDIASMSSGIRALINDKDQANEVIQSLNKHVFMPLRKAMVDISATEEFLKQDDEDNNVLSTEREFERVLQRLPQDMLSKEMSKAAGSDGQLSEEEMLGSLTHQEIDRAIAQVENPEKTKPAMHVQDIKDSVAVSTPPTRQDHVVRPSSQPDPYREPLD